MDGWPRSQTQLKEGWAINLLCLVDVFCSHRTVDNEIAFDDRLKVLGTWMTDLGLKFTSCFGLLNLSLGESFRFFFHGGHHCQSAILNVMVVGTIGVHCKVYADTAEFVHNKGNFSITAVLARHIWS